MRNRDIELLLPQRDPFLFVDELISVDRQQVVGSMTYDDEFPYYQESLSQQRVVPPMLLVESLVQCGGAGATRLGVTQRIPWGLAALQQVEFFDAVEANSTLRMVVQNRRLSSRLIKQAGTSFCGDRIVLQASWFCVPFTK
ncbi:MAG: 3-hydroxyacyl-ACP dehydratase [Sporomusaceae bacterium]|nr:3-hydroxyacyl-ACP dehydratase [Sporomusaceae bacterium]